HSDRLFPLTFPIDPNFL
ncbi:unnamed protein product, partial [Onchocerca ochengi]